MADEPRPPRPLAVGDWIKSNNPLRKMNPPRRVLEFSARFCLRRGFTRRFVRASSGGSDMVAPWVDEIHLDGKPRRSGWSRVEGPNAA